MLLHEKFNHEDDQQAKGSEPLLIASSAWRAGLAAKQARSFSELQPICIGDHVPEFDAHFPSIPSPCGRVSTRDHLRRHG